MRAEVGTERKINFATFCLDPPTLSWGGGPQYLMTMRPIIPDLSENFTSIDAPFLHNPYIYTYSNLINKVSLIYIYHPKKIQV